MDADDTAIIFGGIIIVAIVLMVLIQVFWPVPPAESGFLIVRFKPGVSFDEARDVIESHNCIIIRNYTVVDSETNETYWEFHVRVPKGEEDELLYCADIFRQNEKVAEVRIFPPPLTTS